MIARRAFALAALVFVGFLVAAPGAEADGTDWTDGGTYWYQTLSLTGPVDVPAPTSGHSVWIVQTDFNPPGLMTPVLLDGLRHVGYSTGCCDAGTSLHVPAGTSQSYYVFDFGDPSTDPTGGAWCCSVPTNQTADFEPFRADLTGYATPSAGGASNADLTATLRTALFGAAQAIFSNMLLVGCSALVVTIQVWHAARRWATKAVWGDDVKYLKNGEARFRVNGRWVSGAK